MELTANFSASYGEPSLSDLLHWAAHYQSRADSFSSALDKESLHVGASYVSAYFNNRPLRSIRLSELVCLNGYTVADCVEPDLDDEGKAGISRTIANLVALARAYAADQQTMLFF